MNRHKILVEIGVGDDELVNIYSKIKSNPYYQIRLWRDITVDQDNVQQLAKKFEEGNPKLVERMNKIVETTPSQTISCPFPYSCRIFPCETLCCNADVCSNGYAYRMS
jgi:hypothetical protein